MTGENFKSANRKNTEIEKLKTELDNAKIEYTNYSKNSDTDNWSWDKLNSFEETVINLEYQLWCAEYEDKRRRNWR